MTRKFCKQVPHKFISEQARKQRRLMRALADAGYTVSPARIGGQDVARTIQPRN